MHIFTCVMPIYYQKTQIYSISLAICHIECVIQAILVFKIITRIQKAKEFNFMQQFDFRNDKEKSGNGIGFTKYSKW